MVETLEQWERRKSKTMIKIGLVSLLSGVATMGYATHSAKTNPDFQTYMATQNKAYYIGSLEEGLSRIHRTRMSAAQEEHMQPMLSDYHKLRLELQEQRKTDAYARGEKAHTLWGLLLFSGFLPFLFGALYSTGYLLRPRRSKHD